MGHRSNDCAGPPGNRGKLDPYIRPRELRRDHLHSLWRRAAAPGHTIRQIASLIFDTWLCDKLFARRGLEPLVLSEPDFKFRTFSRRRTCAETTDSAKLRRLAIIPFQSATSCETLPVMVRGSLL